MSGCRRMKSDRLTYTAADATSIWDRVSAYFLPDAASWRIQTVSMLSPTGTAQNRCFRLRKAHHFQEASHMSLKQISRKDLQKKYGLNGSEHGRCYLRDDGCVVDKIGLVVYHPPLSQTMSAESYALFVEVHDFCMAFVIRSLHDFRGGECEPSCPFHPSNNENGHLPMCTTAFIRDNPGKIREILNAEKEKRRCNETGGEESHD